MMTAANKRGKKSARPAVESATSHPWEHDPMPTTGNESSGDHQENERSNFRMLVTKRGVLGLVKVMNALKKQEPANRWSPNPFVFARKSTVQKSFLIASNDEMEDVLVPRGEWSESQRSLEPGMGVRSCCDREGHTHTHLKTAQANAAAGNKNTNLPPESDGIPKPKMTLQLQLGTREMS